MPRSVIRRTIRSAPSRANRSRSFWSCMTTRPIASLACRRSGIPGLPATRCWKPAASASTAQVKRGLDWLVPMQVLDVRGDWIARRPELRPGGWAFQYANPHYPDVDDTAVVAMAMDRACKTCYQARHGLPRRDRARARMDRRHAERERRLGRVRRRQRILLSQQYPVRRPWRAARSADRRRHRALPVDAGAVRRHATARR